MKTPILALLSLISCAIQSQTISNYAVSTTFFPEAPKVWNYPVSNNAFMHGHATLQFKDPTHVGAAFYLLGELKVDSIVVREQQYAFSSEKIRHDYSYSLIGTKTNIERSMPSETPVHIYYSGFINPSRARSLSDYMRIDASEGVFLRGYYYSDWFPMFIEPNTPETPIPFERIQINLPEGYRAVVSGRLSSEATRNGRYTAIWKPGLALPSDIQCTARSYQELQKEDIRIYYMSDPKPAKGILNYAQQLKTVFASHLKPVHTLETLYIIEMPEYGNISSHNVIGISSDIYEHFLEDFFAKSTLAHELVHPYTAIPIPTNQPFAALIIEGFPSFFHLYGLKKIEDSFDLQQYMIRLEARYLKKKSSGKDRRGNALPAERPILKISHQAIGTYKDRFILSDRVPLFLYHLWTSMGDVRYQEFLQELFSMTQLDYNSFEALVLKYLPNYQSQLHLWLNTNDYPSHLRIKKPE